MKKHVPDPPHTTPNTPAPTPWTTTGVATCMDLFRVQPGIPFDRALEEVSVLLGCISDLNFEGDEESAQAQGRAVQYLSALANALISDLEFVPNRG
ncbi:DUF3077 domain-containing protein [Pseudomonas aeruginosa]